MPDDFAINQWLKDEYGLTMDGQARFRVSWSTGQLEKRFGEFEVHTPAGIFLRTEKGVREVPKYPYNKDRWVLEMLMGIGDNPELNATAKQSYEPLYFFQTKDGAFLPLNKAVIKAILFAWLHREKKTLSQHTEEELKKEEAKKEEFRQLIGEGQQVPHLMDLV